MDDLVVIILTILVAIVGVISQRKKRQEANTTQTQGEANKQPADFWDMIMEQQEQPQQYRTPEPYIEEVDEKPEPVVERPEKPKYSFTAEKEGSSDLKEALKKSLEPKSKEVMVDGERFSLRKAVIFSEILNRKYT